MRAGDHDPSDDLNDAPGDPPPAPGAPRFARLVRGRAARRLSPRRLALGVALGLGVAALVVEAARRAVLGTVEFVAAQPDQQVRFDAVELAPPPPPYVGGGAAGILEAVRRDSHYGEAIPILATDLEAFRRDLSRNPWLEEVKSVRALHGRLVAEVAYRRPLALVEVGVNPRGRREATVIDRHGVELPVKPGRFVWAKPWPDYQPAGEPRPLVSILGLGKGVPDRVGMVLKLEDPAIGEGRVLEAARLAEEVVAHVGSKTPQGRPMPDFVAVLFLGEQAEATFALREAGGRNEVRWGSAPGREAEGEPGAARKWDLLAAFIDASGRPGLELAPRSSLKFRYDKALLVPPQTLPPSPVTAPPPAARPQQVPRPKSR